MKKFVLRLFKGTVLNLIDDVLEEGVSLLNEELDKSESLTEEERAKLQAGALLLTRKAKAEASNRLA